MIAIAPKVGGCDIGFLVHDYALGRNGIVVGGPWVENGKATDVHTAIPWEWLVLYDGGELIGASTNDLQVIT